MSHRVRPLSRTERIVLHALPGRTVPDSKSQHSRNVNCLVGILKLNRGIEVRGNLQTYKNEQNMHLHEQFVEPAPLMPGSNSKPHRVE